MIVFKVTGQEFKDLKEAKTTLGTNRFRKLNREGKIAFIFNGVEVPSIAFTNAKSQNKY